MTTLQEKGTFETYFFRVKGMHCIKCLRKVQSVGADFQTLKRLDVRLGEDLVVTEVRPDFPVEAFIEKVKNCGFDIRSVVQADNSQAKKVNQSSKLMKIGVAGFCSGNIMLLSTAEYLGASLAGLPTFFKYFEFICFLPVFFYSSSTIYNNAWNSVKSKLISIDAPIVLALLGGAFFSVLNLFWFKGPVYFDSLSMFVFLLLSSRFLVSKLQSLYVSGVSTKDLFDQPFVHKKNGDEYELTKITNVKAKDQIKVSRDSFIPVDAYLLSDCALIDDSLYTGESMPVSVSAREIICAGSKNIGSDIILEVKKELSESRISDLVSKLNKSLLTKTSFQSKADLGAGYLTYLIIISALAILVYFSFVDFEEGMNRALALLVVACPCGLAIALPTVQALGVKRGLRNSLLIKDPNSFENCEKIKNVVFDKTGTLTAGGLSVSSVWPRDLTGLEKDVIYSLEERSEHPIARTLQNYVGTRDKIKILSFEEHMGSGVSGHFEGDFYELSFSESAKGDVVLRKNKEDQVFFSLKDEVDESSSGAVDFFKNLDLNNYILSGDSSVKVFEVADALKINRSSALYRQTPEDKQKFTEKDLSDVLYIGDGANDSVAMSRSLISVSMSAAADVAFKASQIHILKGGVGKAKAFFLISKIVNKSIRRIIFFSLVYNIIFAFLACLGFISPLVAILIMPLSSVSITVLGFYMMTKKVEGLK